MPVQKCTSSNKSGYKFGVGGKCFTGRGSKARATRQGRAIKSRGGR